MEIIMRQLDIVIICFIVLYISTLAISGFEVKSADLGAKITKIARNKHDENVFFIGGDNFVAAMHTAMQHPLYLKIGPVNEAENCPPGKSVPCVNSVTVLEIDEYFNQLLMCGSAYGGTCTMHDLTDISHYFCLNSYNKSDSNVVSSYGEHRTLAHFLTPREIDEEPVPVFVTDDYTKCRSEDFGVLTILTGGRDIRDVPDARYVSGNTEDASDEYKKKHSFEMDSIVQSRIMIATFQESGWSDKPLQPLISMRYILNWEDVSEMLYSGRNYQAEGIFWDTPKAYSFKADFQLSFSKGNYSYFLSVMSERNKKTITTLSRANSSDSSLLPYIEVPLECRIGRTMYPILTASVVGTVGLQQASATLEVPVLILAFARGSPADPKKPDKKQGTAICAYPLDTLDKQEFDYGQKVACPYQAQPVPWSDNTEGCQTFRATYGGSKKAIHEIPDQLVTALFTHTQTTQKGATVKLIEKMYLYVVHPEVSYGFKLKKELEMGVSKSGTTYKVLATKVAENVKNRFHPPNRAAVMHSPPIGKVDHSRAIMFLAYGQKVYSLNLDFCRQYTTCTNCQNMGSGQCIWCPSQNTCMDRNSESCQSSSEGSCPPHIDFFKPKEIPIGGGSTLSVSGRHLGKHNIVGGKVTVTICGQPCDDVFANVNSLTCKVRPRPLCANCDKCDINVTVTGNKDSNGHGVSSSQIHYVASTVTNFKPRFGPLVGGTIVQIWGDNLLSVGTKKHVKVAGVDCTLLPSSDERDEESLMCQMTKSTRSEETCGSVTVQIDDSVIESTHGNYCLKMDPVILRVRPMKMIESGGITLQVEGNNFDSTPSMDLVIRVLSILDMNAPVEFRSDCWIESSQKMSCESPNMGSKTKPFFNEKRDTTEIAAVMTFDMGNTMVKASNLQSFSIRRDPVLFLIEDSESTLIHRRLKDYNFIIKGNYIPNWMNVSDVIVMVGKTRCDVVEMTEFEIRCNVIKVLKAYRRDYANSLHTTLSPQQNNTLSGNGTEEKITSIKPSTTTSTTLVTTDSYTTTLGPTSDSPSNQTVSPISRNSTVTAISKNGMSRTDVENGSVHTTNVEDHPHGWDRKNSRFPLPYPLTVQIGNWKKKLGTVNVGPYPRAEEDPSTDKALIEWTPKLISIAAGIGVVVLFCLPGLACFVYIRNRKNRSKIRVQQFYMGSLSARSASHSGSGEPSIPSLIQILHTVLDPSKRDAATKMIIKLDQIKLGTNIGSGNFGCVYEGTLSKGNGPPQKVAIKTLQEQICQSMDLTSFVQEAVIMMDFHHEHVLGLVGLAEKEPGVPYVILPYMENGDLLTYIRNPKRVLYLYDVIQFAADISSGMSYLSTLKFVHRDLAARNCMLDKDYRVKVADFGLCRDIYEKGYYTSDNKKKLPIRWMAVESIESGAYSTKSDVWSMGVVLWELLTRGLTPYPGVNGWDIINFLRRRRLEPPFYCPENLYRLMMNCWAKDPALRPTFKALQRELLLMIGKELVLSTPATPEPTRNPKGSFQQTSEYSLPQGEDGGGFLIPMIQINQDEKAAKSNKSKEKGSKEKGSKEKGLNESGLSSSVMSLPRSNLVKNAKIVIPTCYEYRDVKKFAVADYLQLVDNYETAPRFTNPFLRSKKRRSKTGKTNSKEKNSKELKLPHLSRNSGKKTNSAGYSFPPEEFPEKRYVIPRTESDGKLIDLGKKDSTDFSQNDIGNYFELEHNQRASNISVLNSSCHSSVILDKTASMASLLDRNSGGASSIATSCQSLASSNSSAHFQRQSHSTNRGSEINMRPSHLLPQNGGRHKSSSIGISPLSEEDTHL